jgi:hypothetical protein
MLSSISWATYVTAIIIFLIVYYVMIAYRYYMHDLLALSHGQKQTQRVVSFTQAQTPVQEELVTEKVDQLPVQSLADEISAYLQAAFIDGLERADIVASLCSITDKYAPLKSSEYKYALAELIISETETCCDFHLSNEEMGKVWNIGQA